MKLPDPGKSGLQHLDIGLRGDRLDVVGAHAADETIHHVAPGPKTVGGCASEFGEACHAALEGVTVQIRRARKPDPVALIAELRRNTDPDAHDMAGVDDN